jgi:hypothetical protein
MSQSSNLQNPTSNASYEIVRLPFPSSPFPYPCPYPYPLPRTAKIFFLPIRRTCQFNLLMETKRRF